jgi:uncharacterized protein YjbJ (UPF0337 family)
MRRPSAKGRQENKGKLDSATDKAQDAFEDVKDKIDRK